MSQGNVGSCSFSQLSIKEGSISEDEEEPLSDPIDVGSCSFLLNIEGPISEDEGDLSYEEEEPPIDPCPPFWDGFPDFFAAWGIPSRLGPNAVWEPPKFLVPSDRTLPPPPCNDKGQLLSLQLSRPGVECAICGKEHWTSGCPYLIYFPPDGCLINHRDFRVVCACNQRVVDVTEGCNSGYCLPGRPMRVIRKISYPSPGMPNTSI